MHNRNEASRLRRAIFGAARNAGLDDDARHDLQLRVTGKASLTDMSAPDMHRVLSAMNGSTGGGPSARSPGDVLPPGSLKGTLTALWISAWHLGVVRDRRDSAICAFVRRQTGLEAARFASVIQMADSIEALKRWMARDGGVDWSPYLMLDGTMSPIPAARALEAMWRRAEQPDVSLAHYVAAQTGDTRAYHEHDTKTLNRLIADLGVLRRSRV